MYVASSGFSGFSDLGFDDCGAGSAPASIVDMVTADGVATSAMIIVIGLNEFVSRKERWSKCRIFKNRAALSMSFELSHWRRMQRRMWDR